MAERNEQQEHSLEALYAQRKSEHLAPASIKKNVLLKQNATQDTKPMFQRIMYIATVACTLLLFGLFGLQKMDNSIETMPSHQVYIHSLTPELPESEREKINNRYAKHYQEYLLQQKTFAMHHKKRAALELVNNGWQLKTCDDQVMLISNELVAALAKINQLDNKLKSGDVVNVAFDIDGMILTIEQSNKPMLCT